MSISGRAKIAGIVGDPVAQSLSPRLHAFWLDGHDVDGAYVPLPVRAADFVTAITGLRATGFAGVNVTVPHKEAAFALATRHDAAAAATGAVNLLVFQGDAIEGRNTDAIGLRESLLEHLGPNALRGKPVAILGAGGAARGAIHALDALGVSEVRLIARDANKAEHLAQRLKGSVKSRLVAFPWAGWPKADLGLLLNATSGGMRGKSPLDLSLDALPSNVAVCDIVYNPLETDLLAKARASGHVVVDGLGMLMHQAVPSFEAFYGVRPSVTPSLRTHLEKALHGP